MGGLFVSELAGIFLRKSLLVEKIMHVINVITAPSRRGFARHHHVLCRFWMVDIVRRPDEGKDLFCLRIGT
jgi:hypothetical protein